MRPGYEKWNKLSIISSCLKVSSDGEEVMCEGKSLQIHALSTTTVDSSILTAATDRKQTKTFTV